MRKSASLALMTMLAVCLPHALAATNFTVSIEDPDDEFRQYHDQILENMLAAGESWSQYLMGDASIDLQIRFADISTAEGSSVTSNLLRREDGLGIYEMGAASEIRTGTRQKWVRT